MYKVINISKNYEEFFLFKHDYEKFLIEQKSINEKMELMDFINFLKIDNNIYINGDLSKPIPFALIKYNNNEILITNSDDDGKNNLLISLEKIDFDLTKLKNISENDIINMSLNKTTNDQVFIINNRYKKI